MGMQLSEAAMSTRPLAILALVVTLGSVPHLAYANANDVGLGVAAGVAYSGTRLELNRNPIGTRFAWGFFVDIPLLETFYITPATMIYELDAGSQQRSMADVDLNFKFVVPLGYVHIGAGVTTGLTTGLDDGYVPHWGALGFASVNLVANLDGFVIAQYKKKMRDGTDIDDLYGYAGGMFRF